tara:strand:+ start:2692 stop:2973 length:282 start_codon:yes stop_codon:yes gene_type:complete
MSNYYRPPVFTEEQGKERLTPIPPRKCDKDNPTWWLSLTTGGLYRFHHGTGCWSRGFYGGRNASAPKYAMRVHDRFMEATKWKDGRRVFKDLT